MNTTTGDTRCDRTRPLPWECLCGEQLDAEGGCRRCDLEFDECPRCNATLTPNDLGRCWFCDSAWIWTAP